MKTRFPESPVTGENNRLFVNAVLYVARTGIPREDLAARFGKANSVSKRFDRWCTRGVRERPDDVPGEPELQGMQLDGSVVKAHQHASGSRRKASEKKRTPMPDVASAVPAPD